MSGKKRARGGRRVTVDAEVETSQRERVTYGAPSGTTTTTTTATATTTTEANGSARHGDSAAMERLFALGAGTVAGGGENDADDGLGVWLSESEFVVVGGGARGKSNAVGANGERGRLSVPVAPAWEESSAEKSPGGRRRRASRDGEERRRSEDLFEELLTNVERGAPARDSAPATMEVATTTTASAVNTRKEGDHTLALASMDPDWNDEDEDSQALIDAVTLAEKRAKMEKSASATTTQASNAVPSLSDITLDDGDDDDDLFAAAVDMAEKARDSRVESGTPSTATSPRKSPRKSAAVAACARTQSATARVKIEDGFMEDCKAELQKALEFAREEAEAETEILGTWFVESVASPRIGCVESLVLTKASGAKKTVVLKGYWRETLVSVGDSLILYCLPGVARKEDVAKDIVEVTDDGGVMIILFPAYLISATTIGNGMDCPRQSVLQQQLQTTWGDANEAATIGTIMHDLVEHALLVGSSRALVPMASKVKSVIESNVDNIFAIDSTEKKLQQRIDATIPGVESWANKLTAASRVPKLGRAKPGGNAQVRMNRKAAHDKLRRKCTVGVEASLDYNTSATLQVDDMIDIEELIWAPKLGLKGILDGVANAVIRQSKEDLPLPSVVPIELKTGKWKSVGHDAQVLFYNLMIGERYGKVSPFGVLHYTTDDNDDEGTSKIFTNKPANISALMQRRNHLAAMLRPTPEEAMQHNAPVPHGKARLGNGKLPKMQPQSWCERCFSQHECFSLHRALEGGDGETSELGNLFIGATSHLNQTHETAIRHWIHLIDLESSESLRKRATPWLPVELVNRRASDTYAIDDLAFVRESTQEKSAFVGDNHYYIFKPSSSVAESVLKRVGIADRVVLSRDKGLTVISRAQIIRISNDSGKVVIEMATERPLRRDTANNAMAPLPGSSEESALWRIDKDGASLTMAARTRGNVLALFTQTERAAIIRRRIIDLERPKFAPIGDHKRKIEVALKDLGFPLNDEQLLAVEKIVTAEDYVLVQGFPGAGKTAMLVAAVKALRAQGKSVLITSHTHSAIDNVFSRLPGVGVHEFMRIGDEVKVVDAVQEYRLGSKRWPCSNSDDLRKVSERAMVVGATCHAMGHAYFQRKMFDVVLIDESGQITLPSILPPLFAAKTFVLVGDHHQLPPLVKSKQAIAGGLGRSLLAMLCDAHPDMVTKLSSQYRMAEPLTRLPNILTYDGKLRCGTESVAKQLLSLAPLKDAFSCAPQWLAHVMNPANHTVFLDTSALGAAARETPKPYINEAEMDLVLTTVSALTTHGATSVCALSPFNAQVDAIKARLNGFKALSGDDAPRALTIDKAQGQDMDAVCISFVCSNDEAKVNVLLNDTSRFNVAITRAKKKLILIGNAETLRSSPVLARALEFYRAEGWIVPLTIEALDFTNFVLGTFEPSVL